MSKEKLIIYGNGAMALTYASYLKQQYDVVAYTVEGFCITQNYLNEKPVFPFESLTEYFDLDDVSFIVAVGFVEMNDVRQRISHDIRQLGYKLISYVSPDLMIHDEVTIGENTCIFDKASIHYGTEVGDNVFISSCVNIGHDCKIGNNVWINAGVAIAGGVTIGDNCFVGLNSCISHNVNLGHHTFVGANTLVGSSTQPDSVLLCPAAKEIAFSSKKFLKVSKGMNVE